MNKLDEIAAYAEGHDFSKEMEQGVWDTDTEPDPMITTSLRLPKSLLDWVRERAAAQQPHRFDLHRQAEDARARRGRLHV